MKILFWTLGGVLIGAIKRAAVELDALQSGEISTGYFVGNLMGGAVVWGVAGLIIGVAFTFATKRASDQEAA